MNNLNREHNINNSTRFDGSSDAGSDSDEDKDSLKNYFDRDVTFVE